MKYQIDPALTQSRNGSSCFVTKNKHRSYQPLVLCLTILSFAVVLIFFAKARPMSVGQAASTVLYVAPGGNCGGAAPCYTTIQEAIGAALPGSYIKIANGTYTSLPGPNPPPIIEINKSLTLQGGFSIADWETSNPDSFPTILDAQEQGRVAMVNGEIDVTLTGMQFVNGRTSDTAAGIWVSADNFVLSHSVIRDNVLSKTLPGACTAGVNLFTRQSARLEYNQIQNNRVFMAGNCYDGGGLLAWGTGILIKENFFGGNSSYGGGAMAIYDDVVVMNNTITGNSAIYGGGIHIGGIHVGSGSPLIVGNIITGNNASQSGGGISIFGGAGQPRLINNVIADNTISYGGGWFLGGATGILVFNRSVDIVHNTLARNSGPEADNAAVFIVGGETVSTRVATLYNNVLVDHAVGIRATRHITAVVDGVLWHNTPITISQEIETVVVLANEVYGNPAFAPDGYHLTIHSAAIDQGVDRGVDRDIDGELRPAGAAPDLGADELHAHVATNHFSGAPGSFFTLTGSNYPASSLVTIQANGTVLGSVTADPNGEWSAILDTANADTGAYFVSAVAGRTATTRIMLDMSAPVHPIDGSGPILDVPPGIALQNFVYLPIVIK